MHGSRIFFQEGSWGPTARKQSGQCFFFSPQLILQFTEGVQWFYYRENYTFPRIQRGSNIFQGKGFSFFQGGGRGFQMLISIETHITCDLSGGVRTPYPPLWISTCSVQLQEHSYTLQYSKWQLKLPYMALVWSKHLLRQLSIHSR